jgi:hypothetical protein
LKGGPCKAIWAEDEEEEEEGGRGTMPLMLLPTPPVVLVVVLPEGGKGEDCGTGGGGNGEEVELSPPPPRPSSPPLGLVLMLRLLGLWCPFVVVVVVVVVIMLGGFSFPPVVGAVAPAAAPLSSWPEGGAVDMDFERTRRCKSVVKGGEGKGKGFSKGIDRQCCRASRCVCVAGVDAVPQHFMVACV